MVRGGEIGKKSGRVLSKSKILIVYYLLDTPYVIHIKGMDH